MAMQHVFVCLLCVGVDAADLQGSCDDEAGCKSLDIKGPTLMQHGSEATKGKPLVEEHSSPFGCQAQVPVSDFDMAAFSAGGWHTTYHQPTIFEFGIDSKCSKVAFTDKANLGSGYTFEFFAQAYSGTMQQHSSWLGCGLVDSPGKLKIGTCDSAPDNVNFIVIHHEKGDEEFIVVVGADPSVPVAQVDGSTKCMHEQITPDNATGGLFVFTRTSGTMSDTALIKAKKVVSDNGMIWDGVMMPTPQTDCDYLKPSAGTTLGPLWLEAFR